MSLWTSSYIHKNSCIFICNSNIRAQTFTCTLLTLQMTAYIRHVKQCIFLASGKWKSSYFISLTFHGWSHTNEITYSQTNSQVKPDLKKKIFSIFSYMYSVWCRNKLLSNFSICRFVNCVFSPNFICMSLFLLTNVQKCYIVCIVIFILGWETKVK